MEANELMIGDWVLHPYYKHPSKIVYFNGSRVRVEYEEVEVGALEPIPLTPEILEKNGFSSNYAEDDLSYAQSCGDVIGIHIYGKNGLMDEMDFKYVHQLQQALRLCGIEKGIVL